MRDIRQYILFLPLQIPAILFLMAHGPKSKSIFFFSSFEPKGIPIWPQRINGLNERLGNGAEGVKVIRIRYTTSRLPTFTVLKEQFRNFGGGRKFEFFDAYPHYRSQILRGAIKTHLANGRGQNFGCYPRRMPFYHLHTNVFSYVSGEKFLNKIFHQ